MKEQKEKIFKLNIGGKDLVIESKKMAEQANGNILARMGDTMVMSTCVMAQAREGLGFFPLTVEYEEKYYAAGKIKGARYVRRENRPSDEAICNARIIDRSIRPRFPKNFEREIQVVTTVLSWDGENDPDVLGLIAASQALLMSDIPWQGPVAAVRVCRKNNEFSLNPNYKDREDADIDIIFAGLIDKGEFLVNMIDGDFNEADEAGVLQAYDFAKEPLQKIIAFQEEIAKEIGKEKEKIEAPAAEPELEKEMREFLEGKLSDAIYQKDKSKMSADMETVRTDFLKFIAEKYADGSKEKYAKSFFDDEVDRLVHENVIKYGKRPDGRKIDELRQISCEAGVLPRTHGSGIFTRGQTRSLSILTLGAPGDHQILEGMEISGKKRFMHHYNFPSFSSGEIKPLRGPGRREIGHGMLAEKALLPLIPKFEDFPYTIRVVSEIVSSNGSTSMASVSSSSLALMDAGVPIKSPATGIAIGLMQDEKEYKILTDIQGPEDHHGDMDFKVAGTRKGITAIQLDVKITGINREIMEEALQRAKDARNQILETIEATLAKPRENLSPYAPRILKIQIDPAQIREVIGPGGKIINEIIDATKAAIDIEDSGLIFITAEKEESAMAALEWIKNITHKVAVGETFQGKVKRILEFGAFVEILPGQEGMIHISKLASHRVNKVEDVVNVGDTVSVKVIAIDELGRINLSLIKKQ